MDLDALATSSIASLGNFAGNFAASGYSGRTAKTLQKREQQFNREMAEWQNQVNIANWQMQNDYNSPANQMARFQEAGLNPNLIYGQGSNGNAQSAPQAAAVHAAPGKMPNINFGNIGSDLVSGYYQARQQRNADAITASQVDYNKAKEAQAVQDTALKNAQTLSEMLKYNRDHDLDDVLRNQLRLAVEFLGSQVDTERQRLTNMQSENDLIEARVRNTDMNTEYLQSRLSLTPIEAQVMYSNIRECAQRIVESQARTGLLGKQTIAQSNQNKFFVRTYEDRINQVATDLANSIQRNQSGELEFNIRSFEAARINQFGSKDAFTSTQNLPVDLFRILNVRLSKHESNMRGYE